MGTVLQGVQDAYMDDDVKRRQAYADFGDPDGSLWSGVESSDAAELVEGTRGEGMRRDARLDDPNGRHAEEHGALRSLFDDWSDAGDPSKFVKERLDGIRSKENESPEPDKPEQSDQAAPPLDSSGGDSGDPVEFEKSDPRKMPVDVETRNSPDKQVLAAQSAVKPGDFRDSLLKDLRRQSKEPGSDRESMNDAAAGGLAEAGADYHAARFSETFAPGRDDEVSPEALYSRRAVIETLAPQVQRLKVAGAAARATVDNAHPENGENALTEEDREEAYEAQRQTFLAMDDDELTEAIGKAPDVVKEAAAAATEKYKDQDRTARALAGLSQKELARQWTMATPEMHKQYRERRSTLRQASEDVVAAGSPDLIEAVSESEEESGSGLHALTGRDADRAHATAKAARAEDKHDPDSEDRDRESEAAFISSSRGAYGVDIREIKSAEQMDAAMNRAAEIELIAGGLKGRDRDIEIGRLAKMSGAQLANRVREAGINADQIEGMRQEATDKGADLKAFQEAQEAREEHNESVERIKSGRGDIGALAKAFSDVGLSVKVGFGKEGDKQRQARDAERFADPGDSTENLPDGQKVPELDDSLAPTGDLSGMAGDLTEGNETQQIKPREKTPDEAEEDWEPSTDKHTADEVFGDKDAEDGVVRDAQGYDIHKYAPDPFDDAAVDRAEKDPSTHTPAEYVPEQTDREIEDEHEISMDAPSSAEAEIDGAEVDPELSSGTTVPATAAVDRSDAAASDSKPRSSSLPPTPSARASFDKSVADSGPSELAAGGQAQLRGSIDMLRQFMDDSAEVDTPETPVEGGLRFEGLGGARGTTAEDLASLTSRMDKVENFIQKITPKGAGAV